MAKSKHGFNRKKEGKAFSRSLNDPRVKAMERYLEKKGTGIPPHVNKAWDKKLKAVMRKKSK